MRKVPKKAATAPTNASVELCTAIRKARGIAFVVAAANAQREYANTELTGFALWALADLLREAADTFERMERR